MRLLVFRKPLALRLAIWILLLMLSRMALVECVSKKSTLLIGEVLRS